jgi:hypothetical protein
LAPSHKNFWLHLCSLLYTKFDLVSLFFIYNQIKLGHFLFSFFFVQLNSSMILYTGVPKCQKAQGA